MTSRVRRLQKLLQHRERELEDQVRNLAQAEQLRVSAEQRVNSEREALAFAVQKRAALASTGFPLQSWLESSEWLRSRSECHRVAIEGLNGAALAVEKARAEVLKARAELKKIQAVSERLLGEERAREQQRERRLEDEAAQNKYAQKRREAP